MILDKQTLLSDDQAVTVTAASENILDLGNDDALVQAINEKGGMLIAQVTTAFEGGTSMSVALQTDDDSAFGSATTLFTTAAIVTASLVAGYQYKIALPPISEQYLRLYYTVVGTMSAGNISAGLILDVQTNS